jgi:hypothetical protein
MTMYAQAFAEEEALDETAVEESPAVEYSFQGFDVDFSEKIALLPAGEATK